MSGNIGVSETQDTYEPPKGAETDNGGTNYGGASSSGTKVAGEISSTHTYDTQSSSTIVSSVKISDEKNTATTQDMINSIGDNLSDVTSSFTGHVTGYDENSSVTHKINKNGTTTTTNDGYSDIIERSDAYSQEQDIFNQAKKILEGAEKIKKELAERKDDLEYKDNTKNEKPEKRKGNWELSFDFKLDGFADLSLNKPLYLLEVPKQYVENIIDGSANDWMAGGKHYDSPRAGGQLFNVTGDLNTVKFLGLQDKNYNTHLDRQFHSMGDVQRILEVTAGTPYQDSSSLTKLAQANISRIRDLTLKHNAVVYDELYKYDEWSHMSKDEKSEYLHGQDKESVGDYVTSIGGNVDAILDDWFNIGNSHLLEIEADRMGDDFDDFVEDIGESFAKVFGW